VVHHHLTVEDVNLNNALAEDGQLFFPRERFSGAGSDYGPGLIDFHTFLPLLRPSGDADVHCRIMPPDVARITIPLRRPMHLSQFEMEGNFGPMRIIVKHVEPGRFGRTKRSVTKDKSVSIFHRKL
jgi:hypothetical protein